MAAKKSTRKSKDKDENKGKTNGKGKAKTGRGELDLSKITILNAREDLDEYDPAVESEAQEAQGGDDPSVANDGEEKAAADTPEDGYDSETLQGIIEAILFVTPEPMTAAQISRAIGGTSAKDVRQGIKALRETYDASGRSFEMVEMAGGFQLMTRSEFDPYLRRFKKVRDSGRLSAAALETLAIVAYRQPIQRAEVENLRGVGCGPVLRSLMEKRLMRIIGRAEELGRPVLYGTTNEFLQHFGLKSLADLPRGMEFKTGT